MATTVRESEQVKAASVQVGQRIYHDGAFRIVAGILDAGYWLRFSFTPVWGYKREHKDTLVHRWLF